MSSISNPTVSAAASLVDRFRRIRAFSETVIESLSAEDCMVQSMDDVSPTRWHLAHTTWFFETFILKPTHRYPVFDEQFNYLFNSYYNTIGKQFPRPNRGMISRPGLKRTLEYRNHVNEQVVDFLESGSATDDVLHAMQVGLHHEQQHQELMLTDIKHVLSCNPTLPVYRSEPFANTSAPAEGWTFADEGVYEIGHQGDGFSFDNESPRHRVFCEPFKIRNSPVTCGQFIEFIEAGGYQKPEHWLSLGWSTANENEWDAPLYWLQKNDQWMVYTMAGLVPVNPDWPVCHVSYFEADAFARWSGYRLPTEFEWEIIANENDAAQSSGSQFADQLVAAGHSIHPTGESSDNTPSGLMGGTWEWTNSSYGAYPGYAPPPGALGEYNGKFMCNQYVLRGGSAATSRDHIRTTYRNFFPPHTRWQFSGFRLASSL